MKTALIWYTWFVWSNILEQNNFDDLYNSSNINYIEWKEYDLVICAWVKAVKWWANQNSEEDLEWINSLTDKLKTIKTNKFILISTVDVYPNPIWVDEDFDFDSIKEETHHAYGKNRLYLEKFIKYYFHNYYIVRLPWLFGNNIKKNVIFDLLNNNQTEKIIPNCKFQYYYLWNIWKDIKKVIDNEIKEINFNSEPILTQEIIDNFFKKSIVWNKIDKPIIYDYKTKYDYIFWWKNWYMYSKEDLITQLDIFINNYKIWN
jgi:hypothetical protein